MDALRTDHAAFGRLERGGADVAVPWQDSRRAIVKAPSIVKRELVLVRAFLQFRTVGQNRDRADLFISIVTSCLRIMERSGYGFFQNPRKSTCKLFKSHATIAGHCRRWQPLSSYRHRASLSPSTGKSNLHGALASRSAAHRCSFAAIVAASSPAECSSPQHSSVYQRGAANRGSIGLRAAGKRHPGWSRARRPHPWHVCRGARIVGRDRVRRISPYKLEARIPVLSRILSHDGARLCSQ